MKFPRKHSVMMTFLSSMLRDEVNIKHWLSWWNFYKLLILCRICSQHRCFTNKKTFIFLGWIWVQEGDSWYHYFHHRRESGSKGGGFGPFVWIYWRLWTHRYACLLTYYTNTHVLIEYKNLLHYLLVLIFLVLATRILYLLGREGPRTPQPSKYIRFIYNRVILEKAAVRAGKSSHSVIL